MCAPVPGIEDENDYELHSLAPELQSPCTNLIRSAYKTYKEDGSHDKFKKTQNLFGASFVLTCKRQNRRVPKRFPGSASTTTSQREDERP